MHVGNTVRVEFSPKLGKIEVIEDAPDLCVAVNAREILWTGPRSYVDRMVDEHMAWAKDHERHMRQRVA